MFNYQVSCFSSCFFPLCIHLMHLVQRPLTVRNHVSSRSSRRSYRNYGSSHQAACFKTRKNLTQPPPSPTPYCTAISQCYAASSEQYSFAWALLFVLQSRLFSDLEAPNLVTATAAIFCLRLSSPSTRNKTLMEMIFTFIYFVLIRRRSFRFTTRS